MYTFYSLNNPSILLTFHLSAWSPWISVVYMYYVLNYVGLKQIKPISIYAGTFRTHRKFTYYVMKTKYHHNKKLANYLE